MKIYSRLLAALALIWSCGASAEGYFGVVAGLMDVDLPGDSPVNGGLRGGYRWTSGWGVEGEATTSLSDGEFASVDYSLTTVAFYGTYRTPGSVYFAARAGALYEDVDAGIANGSDTGLSAGLGVGFEAGEQMNLQLEYTLIETDVNFWSASMTFRF